MTTNKAIDSMFPNRPDPLKLVHLWRDGKVLCYHKVARYQGRGCSDDSVLCPDCLYQRQYRSEADGKAWLEYLRVRRQHALDEQRG